MGRLGMAAQYYSEGQHEVGCAPVDNTIECLAQHEFKAVLGEIGFDDRPTMRSSHSDHEGCLSSLAGATVRVGRVNIW